ncbi:nucleoid-associated protein [Alicyclobacillus dauci]|uniref:Nucleoid-associated protein n=1 Tax=Alicyclobacillus dauci TaxID=1475485 RepID=A0ABY6Z993_9BACL|nr:nucleoid-associated protein [Alicyclobacillus dauci]WAH36254.1 nucleoid-associated protein [Alicyclobacillus dauci]WAH39424.1 nucleoid-associated protein [Alicyclobacillus dauci]
MLNFAAVNMERLVIHRVGNKANEEELLCSNAIVKIDDEQVQQLLFKYLLQPFRKNENINRFSHSTDIRFNEIYMYITQVFQDPNTFLEQSKNIARHLYENSTHPRIKGGEFYMAYLHNVEDGDIITDAIGLFRTENKETYLKVVERSDAFNVVSDSGINIKALDKGCLVLNTNAEQGYKVYVVDSHSKAANEARYWKDDFLRIEPARPEDAITRDYIEMVGQFVTDEIVDENKIKPVELRSRTLQFFEDNPKFEMSRFEEEVLQEPTYIESFRAYSGQYQEEHAMEPPTEFQISPSSVKSAKRRMKSVIKLDKLVDIYVRSHDPQDLKHIERGHDSAKNMNYYKIYFTDEN